jgi:hypothetical protein
MNGAASPATSKENPPLASGVVVRRACWVAESFRDTEETGESAEAIPVTAELVDCEVAPPDPHPTAMKLTATDIAASRLELVLICASRDASG